MKRFEHGVIAVLLAALAGLSYLHWFRSPGRPQAESSGPKSKSPDGHESAGAPREAGKIATPEVPVPAAGPGEPGESESEARARAYQAQNLKDAAAREQGEFDALLEAARAILASGGVDALLWAPCPRQDGNGNDDDLRRLVAEFAKETDPARQWALAQRIRFHLTDPRGTIWTTDAEATQAFEEMGKTESDPIKRGLALGAGGHGIAQDRLLNDLDPRVRGKAAEMMAPPKGVTEAAARPVADRFRELLASPDARVRAAAAGGFGGWAFRESDVDALVDLAQRDPSADVRAAAARSLGAAGSDRGRRALAEIAADPAQPEAVRAAARSQFEGAGVIPEGLSR